LPSKYYLAALLLAIAGLLSACSNGSSPQGAAPEPDTGSGPPPNSGVITGVRFDFDTLVELAEGSDNWAVTWADDESQFATWGDGGGFGGTDDVGRVSLGVARIEGEPEDFTTVNVWGGKSAQAKATFTGKSYGILALGPDLWLWRTGEKSRESAFERQDLFVSHDNGLTFEPAGVSFTLEDFGSGRGFFAPTFLQFGPGYRGALDSYVYIYAPEIKSDKWTVQKPGEITLMRVPAAQLADRAAYEFFAGLDSRGAPSWTSDVLKRTPVFMDATNGVMHTSVTYNAGLGRYLLTTQQRTHRRGGFIGIYESAAPWGPWHKVLFEDAWEIGLQNGSNSIYWNFSNKWTSADGLRSALVYTGRGPDNFAVVMAEFDTM
jgi:hypothetical protein